MGIDGGDVDARFGTTTTTTTTNRESYSSRPSDVEKRRRHARRRRGKREKGRKRRDEDEEDVRGMGNRNDSHESQGREGTFKRDKNAAIAGEENRPGEEVGASARGSTGRERPVKDV